jgi:L-ascorbate metabolism protein UlaG (beta-lactamase superfamily)
MDHFDGRRFRNLTDRNGQPFRNVPRMLLSRRAQWPGSVEVVQRVPLSPESVRDIVLTFIGHATFLIQSPRATILTDPVWSNRAGPGLFIGPRRVKMPGVKFEDLPAVSHVLLSHNHYDHCDVRTLRALARRFHPQFITPLGNGAILKSLGAKRIEELDWWERTAESSLDVVCTPSQHFSARTPFNRNRMLWGGFVITLGARRIYFVGDSGYAPHFRDVPERCGAIDLALMPIGAYEPRWFMRDIHMNPEEALQAHLDVGAPQSVAMHFGTFQLTPEPIDDPVLRLRAAMKERNTSAEQFTVLDVGESLRLGA